MAILPIDSGRYGTKQMLEVFSEQKKVDYQLEIEGSAALAQSEIGLIPKKMGKNGDQIQRLFRSPAQIFLIQYNGQIAESVLEQMKEFSIAKSAKENQKIFFGEIDGDDTAKLFQAYSN